jgi:tetratricopeptide (TPR) repeat protein
MNSNLLARVLNTHVLKCGGKQASKGRVAASSFKALPLRPTAPYGSLSALRAHKALYLPRLRPGSSNQTRSYSTEGTTKASANQEETFEKIADTWINQETDRELRHELEIIFGRVEDDREARKGAEKPKHLEGPLYSLDRFETSKKLGFTAMNPNHTEPSKEERLGMKIFGIVTIYAEREDRQAQAVLALKQALKWNPFLSEAWYKLGTYYMSQKSSPEAAIEPLEKCIALSPSYVPTYSDLASVLLVLKHYQKAIWYCQKALEMKEDYLPALYNKGLAHQSLEEWKEAIKSFEKIIALVQKEQRAIDKQAENVEVLPIVNMTRVVHALASCYHAAENAAPRIDQAAPNHFLLKSIDMLQGYIVEHEKDDIAQCFLGCAFADVGKYLGAQEAFEAALRANPENLDAHVNLGLMFFSQQKFDSSLKHLEHALDLDPSLHLLHLTAGHVRRMKGDYVKAAEHYKQAININPSGAGEAYLHLGILLFNQHQYALAKPYLDNALRHFPHSIELHYHLALYYKMASQNLHAARTHFEVAYRLTLDAMPASQRFCFSLLDSGNYQAFSQAMHREFSDRSASANQASSHEHERPTVSAILPSSGSFQAPNASSSLLSTSINAASLLGEVGRLADAISVYQAILQSHPRYVPAHFNLAKAYESTNTMNKAIEHLMMAVECDPKFFEAQLHLGSALASMGQYDRAITYLKEAVNINRSSAAAWHSLADCEVELGQYRTAQQSYNHVVRLNPTDSDAHVGIGVCFFHLQRYRDAEMAFRQALDISQDSNPLAFYNMSSTLLALHRTDEALQALHKSIQLDPSFANAHLDYALLLAEVNPKKLPSDLISHHLTQAVNLDPSQMERVPQNLKNLISSRSNPL